ncbi:MAG: hypothetical protein V4591_01540 [Bdellovibrionota bacterium]
MLIRFLVLISLLINLNICYANQTLNVSENKKIIFSYNEKNYFIKLKINNREKEVNLLNPIDADNIPNEIGEIERIDEKYTVIAKIKHPTKPSGGSCGAGVEVVLSVIDLNNEKPREIYTEKIASCQEFIELSGSEDDNTMKIGGYFSWNKDAISINKKEKTITLHWWTNRKKEGKEITKIKINNDSTVTVIDK